MKCTAIQQYNTELWKTCDYYHNFEHGVWADKFSKS